MKRTEIALLGAPSTDALRLEVTGYPGDDGLALEFLHDERQTGTLARVLGGRVGLGEVSVPVAVKLQRDMALSQEDRGSVAAKFDKERNVHRRLQEQAAEGAGPEKIVRQLEVWRSPAEHEADFLEPCILCARARHGLAPRCPECRDPAAMLEELELTNDRGLRCSRCQRQFWSTPKTRDGILDATLRRDPACRGCALEQSPHTDDCRRSALFLNFFRNRVLLLERLDLDLEDYLRWGRGNAAAGARKAARQAFEQHARLLHERRAQLPGPSVAKTADLLRVADLFSEIVAGVEHLHQHDVAHLDLKPANVCVRFRGAELEVKIIDLGLSDDPNTLTYLRQAEGPLSLWTDYSAPEFRRPRCRPIGVAGRFREEACELDWPRGEGPSLELPYAGDLLFVDDREVPQQRFRVVSVRPGAGGGLLVQAEAEAQHCPWRGQARALPALGPGTRVRVEVEVVLEKHCGFPADVYSLGMLLLAMLVGSPDVGDFREALPSIQIELEEHLHARATLPGRALVQQLLGEQSKHLHVFHAYAHRLAAYGVAQPLAEELLGIVLRATLRGPLRAFYLSDRGADARPALRRLRDDLDAVRAALRNALTAAEAAVVRDTRLTVLHQLRARLHNGPAGAPLPRPDAAGRLLYPALDLSAAGDEYRERELLYLSPLAGEPGSALGRWERELCGPTAESAGAGRAHDFLMRYCRLLDPSAPAAADFLHAYQRLRNTLARSAPAAGAAQLDDRERAARWVGDHQALATRLEAGADFVKQFEGFLAAVGEKLLTPWDRALRVRQLLVLPRKRARLPLNRFERAALADEAAEAALHQLGSVVQQATAVRRDRGKDFENALLQWRTWCAGRAWVDALVQVETGALQQRQQAEAAGRQWDDGWGYADRNLRDWLARLRTLLHLYDPLLAGHAPEELTVWLTRGQREALGLEPVRAALAWLNHNWPAPGEHVEALFALWELESGRW
jgi:hypothetical protein